MSARVSIPWMPTTPWRRRYSSRLSAARKFEAIGEHSRTMNPFTHGFRDSTSSPLIPQLPISGYVIATICPRYDGSVKISW